MEAIAERFKGLSDSTRLRILNLLADGELCVCDLIAILDMPQSTISRHLSYLRRTEWIEGRRNGKWMYYRRPSAPTPFQAYVFALLGEELSLLPQAVTDNKALMHRLATKDSNECTNTCSKKDS